MLCSEGSAEGEEDDRFEKIGFSLSVFSINDIELGSKENFGFFEIAEISQVKCFKHLRLQAPSEELLR